MVPRSLGKQNKFKRSFWDNVSCVLGHCTQCICSWLVGKLSFSIFVQKTQYSFPAISISQKIWSWRMPNHWRELAEVWDKTSFNEQENSHLWWWHLSNPAGCVPRPTDADIRAAVELFLRSEPDSRLSPTSSPTVAWKKFETFCVFTNRKNVWRKNKTKRKKITFLVSRVFKTEGKWPRFIESIVSPSNDQQRKRWQNKFRLLTN